MCKVSVIVPVYNTEMYLEQCLESIVYQTLKDIEIICINDGSADNSLRILNQFAIKDSRIKIIDKKNTGYGHSMNIGIASAKGEYIGIVESDDYIEPNMYEALYKDAICYNADIVKSNYFSFQYGSSSFQNALGDGPYSKIIIPREEVKSIFLRGQFIWSAIYKRDFLLGNDIKFIESSGASYQDTSFYYITMACANRVVLIKDAYLHYRKDNLNSSVKSKSKIFSVCDELCAIWDFLEKNPDIKNKLQYNVPEFQWNVYQWNLNRLAESYKCVFLERIYDEFKIMEKNGLLKRECWNNKNAFDEMMDISMDKEKFLYSEYVSNQMKRMYKNLLINELKSYSCIYVYGAGIVGRDVIKALERNGICVNLIVVSDPKNNSTDMMGYKIIGINELLNEDSKDAVFLIAVKESSQYPIIKELLRCGYVNVIALTKDLRKTLIE